MSIKVGQWVKFKYGKQPISNEHQRMAARRGNSISEINRINKENQSIAWQDCFVNDMVHRIEGEFLFLRDDYRIKISDVVEVLDAKN